MQNFSISALFINLNKSDSLLETIDQMGYWRCGKWHFSYPPFMFSSFSAICQWFDLKKAHTDSTVQSQSRMPSIGDGVVGFKHFSHRKLHVGLPTTTTANRYGTRLTSVHGWVKESILVARQRYDLAFFCWMGAAFEINTILFRMLETHSGLLYCTLWRINIAVYASDTYLQTHTSPNKILLNVREVEAPSDIVILTESKDASCGGRTMSHLLSAPEALHEKCPIPVTSTFTVAPRVSAQPNNLGDSACNTAELVKILGSRSPFAKSWYWNNNIRRKIPPLLLGNDMVMEGISWAKLWWMWLKELVRSAVRDDYDDTRTSWSCCANNAFRLTRVARLFTHSED